MKIYLVGGAVRDTLLHHPFQEKDWVVVGSSPEKMENQGYRPVGKDFPVFLHPETNEEYALARTERKVAPGYKGFTFYADSSISLEQDLERRDLTINAMAMDQDNTIIDPYQGQQDIQLKILRHVSSAFNEDPVRVLRVARFAARYHYLGFTIAPETIELMRAMVAAGETQHLVAERVWQECHKALSEKNPEVFFQVLQECGALKDLIPNTIAEVIAEAAHYLTRAKDINPSALIRFAAWCFAMTPENITATCERLLPPKSYYKLAYLTRQHYASITSSALSKAEDMANLFIETDALRKPERFEHILLVCEAIVTAKNKQPFTAKDKLLEALIIYGSVEPQELIQQGYKGKELGEAIQKTRVDKLQQWLSNK